MIKFNLVMADTDELYITGLSKFARTTYTSKFNVHVFTQQLHLVNFLSTCRDKVDILLVSQELLPENIEHLNMGIVILLSDGRQDNANLPTINKYQSGTKVLNDVIELYSGENYSIQSVVKGNRRTSIVTVFSPYGGSGKTTISVWLSMQLARMNFKTLYLNLESLSSLPFSVPHMPTSQGLSNILLHLKTAPNSLTVKLGTALSFNSQMNISYLLPPCCCLELDELTGHDLEKLVEGIKDYGQFDMVIIDIDSVLNSRTISLMKNSDCTVLVLTEGTAHKSQAFESELDKILGEQKLHQCNKIVPIINKCTQKLHTIEQTFNGKPVTRVIPILSDLNTNSVTTGYVNLHSSIRMYIKSLAENVVEKMGCSKNGG